jgi:hypothetical protein
MTSDPETRKPIREEKGLAEELYELLDLRKMVKPSEGGFLEVL